ncbi:phage tail protein [Burkholderia multivorans]|nr:phage tail protein [Burkholderia multivorans]
MSVPSASATAVLSADEIVVESGLGGLRYCLANFSKTLNLGVIGAGGMDAGAAPSNGYVAIYAILNPTTGATSLLATNATSSVQSNTYSGASMPAGYTASGLVSVWPTNGSRQLVVGFQQDRNIAISPAVVLNTSTQQSSATALSISGTVPPNAKAVSGYSATTVTGSSSTINLGVYSASTTIGLQLATATISAGNGFSGTFNNLALSVPQIMYYIATSSGGTPNFQIIISGYSI